MAYLTKDEVVDVISRLLKEKVNWYFTQPGYPRDETYFLCVLVHQAGGDKYLSVCTLKTQPRNSRPIVGFNATRPDDEPDRELIEQKVGVSWDFLSDLKMQ
ncbi:MAG TPA: hypothetical protein VJJ98_04030 [Sedimentisphaerales bacterium]|nr:hypothetical protein [Sedimentisphaerales bacterium]